MFAQANLASYAQNEEDDYVSETEEEPKIYKPTIGANVGFLTFYGDLSRKSKGNNPATSRIAYEFKVTQPFSKAFDLDFYIMRGTVGANERSINRNLNFQSTITTGGIMVTYNFKHLIKNEFAIVRPYLSVGFEGVEFLSKTDLYDVNGNKYFYWTDGTIRSLDENSDNARNAVRLQRDYSYETDIRSLNADGFGKYPEFTFGIPISAGVNMRVTDRVNMKIGATYHYMFTDYIDGITSKSVGNRQGDSRTDNMLMFSAGLTFDLAPKERDKRKMKSTYKNVDFLALEAEDTDGDGVRDFEDDCPQTPSGEVVDAKGCPTDSDHDGFPDFADKEVNSIDSINVDQQGVYMSDEMIYNQYLIYMDSLGLYANIERTVHSSDPGRRKPRQARYEVQLVDENQQLSSDQAQNILNIKDVQSTEINGKTVITAGQYDNISDALARKKELEKQGLPTSNIVRREVSGSMIKIYDKGKEVKQVANLEETGKVYRIQLGAFKQKADLRKFSDAPLVISVEYNDGFNRYYSGSYKTFEEAAKARVDLLNKYPGAFIVAFEGGKQVSFSKTGGTINKDYVDALLTGNENIKKEDIKFRVQIAAYKNQVPVSVVEKFVEIGNVKQFKQEDTTVKYVCGEFSDYNQANEYKQQLIESGFSGAFIVGEYRGRVIPATQALELLK